jgi:hypothetical protein
MAMDVEVCRIERIEVKRSSYISFNFETFMLVYWKFDIETSLGDHLFTVYSVLSFKYEQPHWVFVLEARW